MDPDETSRWWRDLVLELAGEGADLRQGLSEGEPLAQGPYEPVVTLAMEGALFRQWAPTLAEAYRKIAYAVGEVRLHQHLEQMGWTELDEMIDETTYVIGRDRSGLMWGIGIAAVGDDRRAYLERDMRYDAKAERIAIVEPQDLLTPDALVTALGIDPAGAAGPRSSPRLEGGGDTRREIPER